MRFSLLDRVLAPQGPVPDPVPRSASRLYHLDSALPGACFAASIQAWWRPAESVSEETIFQHLHKEANAVTGSISVLDADAANDKVNGVFAARHMIPQGGIRLVDARATLSVAKDDLDYAERRAGIERQAHIEAAALEARYAHLVRLRELFLSDAAMAGLWWSNGDPDRVLRLDEHMSKLDTIVSMVSGSPGGPAQQDMIAPLIARFLTDLGPEHREYLISQLAKIFESYRQPSLADELRATV
jgi:hypothetical protein